MGELKKEKKEYLVIGEDISIYGPLTKEQAENKVEDLIDNGEEEDNISIVSGYNMVHDCVEIEERKVAIINI